MRSIENLYVYVSQFFLMKFFLVYVASCACVYTFIYLKNIKESLDQGHAYAKRQQLVHVQSCCKSEWPAVTADPITPSYCNSNLKTIIDRSRAESSPEFMANSVIKDQSRDQGQSI